MLKTSLASAFAFAVWCAAAAPASAQTAAPTGPQTPAPALGQAQSPLVTFTSAERRWSVDFGLGWDVNLGGNLNVGGTGVLSGLAAVVPKNGYGDIYGTGLLVRVGAGYTLDSLNEVRVGFWYQSLTADLMPFGELGTSTLYAQFDSYKHAILEGGVRRYLPRTFGRLRAYGEGTAGLGFISAIGVQLAAPGANVTIGAADFYERTTALTLSGHAGVLWNVHERVDLNGQIGLRYTTAPSRADAFLGTGLDGINRGNGRWTIPFIVGASLKF